MATTTIHLSPCYCIHVTASKVLDTTARHLKLESSFTGAKDPNERRTLYQATLEQDQLDQVIAALKDDT